MAEKVWKTYKDLPPGPVCTIYIDKVNKTGTWRTFKPIIDYKRCTSCFICWKFCPDVSIQNIDDKPVINYDFCKGCGICAEECPKKAIEMVLETGLR
jgi:2-oxoacid:acceptor oxidoreductase delta subunit (pyruvate/2-ketoisovalerate family)